MRSLDTLPIDLTLYHNIKHGATPIRNMKAALAPSWRRSIRSRGGYWMATASYLGTRDEMLELFLDGMMREIRETAGGQTTWQGFLAGMDLTLDGMTFTRAWGEMLNKCKVIYARLGDNLFSDGSAESAAWSAYNTPTTLEQSAVWRTHGNYSCHIVADSNDDGAIIETGIPIVAGKGYECRVTTNIVSGGWQLEIYLIDTGSILGVAQENTAGQRVMRAEVSMENEISGDIGVRIFCSDEPGEIYADEAVFQESPVRAETSWYEDLTSQKEWGVMEEVLLEAGMSDASANGKALAEVTKRAWPRTIPPDEFQVLQFNEDESSPDSERQKLDLTFYGYGFTLRNKHTLVTGTNAASAHMSNLISAAEFVTAATIQENTMDYKIDERGALRTWEIVRDIALAGDADGNRWNCGVYGGRVFVYVPAEEVIQMRIQNGQVIDKAGKEMDGWFVMPGLAYIDDMPIGPGSTTGYLSDDPHIQFIEEVEFDVAEWLKGNSGVRVRREVND